MPLRFCANLSMMFKESPALADRYALAAKAGFSAVECAFPYDTERDALAEAKDAAKVEQVLINVPAGDHLGCAASIGKESNFKKDLENALDYCKALNCKRYILTD